MTLIYINDINGYFRVFPQSFDFSTLDLTQTALFIHFLQLSCTVFLTPGPTSSI